MKRPAQVEPAPGKDKDQLVSQFLANQSKELAIRAQELELQKKQDQYSFEYATKALEAQAGDRQFERKHERRLSYVKYGFASLGVVAVAILCAYALFMKETALAKEIIQAAIYLFAGGAGGYAIGRNRSQPGTKEEG